MKPRLLIAIYANPDYYPPTVYAVRILSRYFQIHILSRNMDEPIREWSDEVTIERFGTRASAREKEAMGAASKLSEYANYVLRTRRLIREIRPALVYAYDPHAFVASMLGRDRKSSSPVVFHAHEYIETNGVSRTSLQKWIVELALKYTGSANAVVFPERNRARCWFEAAGLPQTATIVPNCPTRDYFEQPPDWSATIAARFRAREMVYVGYASADNGHLEALRALAMIPDVRLRVVGGYRPEFRVSFEALVNELRLADRVLLDGWRAQDELITVASAASAGLSLHKPVSKGLEYLGSASNKLFEYAAMGLPVVVPDRGSYREFLGESQWVVYADVEDPPSIASSINSIFADRERYVAMSRAARRAFEEEYNYELVFAPALERILQLSGISQSDAAR